MSLNLYAKLKPDRKRPWFATNPLLSVSIHISLVVVPVVILLILGCGNDDGSKEILRDGTPSQTEPNYYPMSVGNRWIYRNPDGSRWTRQVTETDFIGSRQYYFFAYNPPVGGNQLGFLEVPVAASTASHLLFRGGNEIQGFVRQTIYELDGIPLLSTYETSVDTWRELVLLRFPLYPDKTWDSLNIRLSGSYTYGPPVHGWEVTFEADWIISGRVGHLESVNVPAGSFEHCLKVEYKPKQSLEVTANGRMGAKFLEGLRASRQKVIEENLATLFTRVIPKLGFETVWLAPGIGPVKIETPNGIAELIDYELKAVASEKDSGQLPVVSVQ